MLARLSSMVVCRLAEPSDAMQATGIPPHVSLLNRVERIEKRIISISPAIEAAVPAIIRGVKENVSLSIFNVQSKGLLAYRHRSRRC